MQASNPIYFSLPMEYLARHSRATYEVLVYTSRIMMAMRYICMVCKRLSCVWRRRCSSASKDACHRKADVPQSRLASSRSLWANQHVAYLVRWKCKFFMHLPLPYPRLALEKDSLQADLPARALPLAQAINPFCSLGHSSVAPRAMMAAISPAPVS